MIKHHALWFLVACERSGPVETTPGSSTPAVLEAPPPIADATVATVPIDTAKLASVDAAPGYSDEDMQAMVKILAAEADSLRGDMAIRRPGQDLADQIDNVRDSSSGTRNGPSGRVTVSRKASVDDTSLTPDVVLRKLLPVYLPGIKRCYATYLKKDPSARGKMGLSFTVTEAGRAVSPKATGFVKEIDDCVAGLITSWRFPIPKKAGKPTEASFVFDLHLVPD
jgi:hypothetical protein